MYFWRHIPLLRLLFPFIIGIICSAYFDSFLLESIVVFTLLILVIIGSHFYLKRTVNLNLQKLVSSLVLLLFFLLGVLYTNSKRDILYSNHFSKVDRVDYILARVIDLPSEKEKSVGCLIEVTQAHKESSRLNVQGKAQVYLAKDSHSLTLSYGDYILISGTLNDVEHSRNPYQFDFKKYYANKNIYQNGFLQSDKWKKINHSKTSPIYYLGYKWRASLQKVFQKYFKNKGIRGVAQAIVFGYKAEIEEEWLQAFSKTGTIHVLAVSGLHVGILYILLGFLLQLGKSTGRSRMLKSAIILLVLFLYSLITGFSPSVSRASIMFGIVIIAKAFSRNTNIYNTLAFACFFLLVLDPLNIYNVGFQFSFLAVLGIVYYKDIFRSIWSPTSYLGDKINTLLSVSVSAQISTFPLGLYYFHQYPNLFIFSNLIVIPCISIILYLGLLTVIFSGICEPIAAFFAKVAGLYIEFIVRTVTYIQNVPFAFFEYVHITFCQMVIIYVFIISVTLALVKKWTGGFILSICAVIGFTLTGYIYVKQHSVNEVVFFDVRNETLIGFKNKDEVTCIASKGVYINKSSLDFVLQPYLVNERKVNNYTMFPLEAIDVKSQMGGVTSLGNGFIWFNNMSFLILDQYSGYINCPIEVDYLIIGKKKSVSFLKHAKNHITYKKVLVLDTWKSEIIGIEFNNSVIFQKEHVIF